MKNKTQAAQSPCPKTTSLVVPIILTCALAAAVTLGPILAWEYFRSRPVTCHECDHVVKRASATQKKKYDHAFGRDDKYAKLYFCKQHQPAWDYAVNFNGQEFYFMKQMDREVSNSGAEITNVESYYAISSNKLEFFSRTNIGGTVGAKHLE